MTTAQTNLFETAPTDQPYREIPAVPAHARDSATSRRAAEAQIPHLSRLQRQYMHALRASADGLTDHEASALMNRPLSSICARRNECKRLGLVRDSGRTRESCYGAQASIWIARESGERGASDT